MPDMDADGDVARPSLSYAAIAEKLLAHRLAQPDLSPSGDNEQTALPHAFRRLAEVFALDHAAAAGERGWSRPPAPAPPASCSNPLPAC